MLKQNIIKKNNEKKNNETSDDLTPGSLILESLLSLSCSFSSISFYKFYHLLLILEKENGERRDVIKGEVPKKMCLRQSDLLLLNASAYCAEEVEHFNGLGSPQCLNLNLFNNRKHLFSVTMKIYISFPVT